MIANMKGIVVPSDLVQKTTTNSSIQLERKKDIERIKKLLKLGFEPEFYSKNNWFKLGGETFNGFTKEQVEEIKKEVCDDEQE